MKYAKVKVLSTPEVTTINNLTHNLFRVGVESAICSF